MKILFFLFLLISIIYSSQVIPIPTRPDGVVLGNLSTSKIHLEAHYDLLCPDCKDSYGNLTQIIKEFDLLNKNFSMTVHFYPWAFHTLSFLTTIGAKFIQTNYPDKILPYIEMIFMFQDQFSQQNLSYYFAKYLLSKLASIYIAVPQGELQDALDNQTYIDLARVSLKIGTQRGVVATPTYFVNDVRLDDSKTYGYKEWLNFTYEYILDWHPPNKFLH